MLRIQINDGADLDLLKKASREVFSDKITVEEDDQNPQLIVTPLSTFDELVTGFKYLRDLVPWPGKDKETLYFDIETHNAGKQWDMPLEEFFRMGQFAWGIDGEVHLTTDLKEMQEQMDKAYGLVAHNGHTFDFSVMLGEKALDVRTFDTMVFGNLAFPAPSMFTDRSGRKHYLVMAGQKKQVPHSRKWLSLDNLCFQLKVPGKVAKLEELAKKYNPPKTLVKNLDYSLIPLDDPEFLEYGKQDVVALQFVTRALIEQRGINEYDWRDQRAAAINAQISRNGFRVDREVAQARIDEQVETKNRIIAELEEKYDFPTTGKAPWSSKVGKAAILKGLSDFGIVPENIPDWPMGKTGPSLAGEVLKEHSAGTPAEEFANAIAILAGQRPLAGQALDFTCADGKVHPDITSLQASGRMSVTSPSLATWSAHGPKAQEKEYFIASEGNVILEFDFSNADSRAVAAMSGDPAYFRDYFSEGIDGHEVTGRRVYGKRYDSDPEKYRQNSKIGSHGWNYGAGAKRLHHMLKAPLEDMYAFTTHMATTYKGVVAWQNQMRDQGLYTGFVVNSWKRKMKVDPDDYWTTSPALAGQSSTRELLFDGLMKLPRDILKMVVVTVHDAIVLDVPKEQVDRVSETMVECFSTVWNGVPFPLSRGKAANNWWEAGH